MKKEKETGTKANFADRVVTTVAKFVALPMIGIGSLAVMFDAFLGMMLIFLGCVSIIAVALFLVVKIKLEEKKKKPETQLPETYIVDPSVPYEELSLIQKLAVDQFEGDLVPAWEYVFTHIEKEKQPEYTRTINSWEASAAHKVLQALLSQKVTQEEFKKTIELELLLGTMKMTKEQVLMYGEESLLFGASEMGRLAFGGDRGDRRCDCAGE